VTWLSVFSQFLIPFWPVVEYQFLGATSEEARSELLEFVVEGADNRPETPGLDLLVQERFPRQCQVPTMSVIDHLLMRRASRLAANL
jgi:hypothetical protein